MEGLKELVKPPFANYDIVVYFGGGLFSVPFLLRYVVEPAGLSLPHFELKVGSSIANEITSTLALLFCIYILGHILAYVSSQFIEKLTDRILGKISTAILVSSWSSMRNRNELIRALIFDRLSLIRHDRALFTTIVRSFVHVPVIPVYIIVYVVGVFGYYDTRVPYSVIRAARTKLPLIGLGEIGLGIRTKWFKPLEHYVTNRMPTATARMYNYLVISGLFRSVSLIFLLSLWAQLYFLYHFWSDGDWFVHPFLGTKGPRSLISEYLVTCVTYIFCFFSYLKFQRRYAEEAIFAFVLGKDDLSMSQTKE